MSFQMCGRGYRAQGTLGEKGQGEIISGPCCKIVVEWYGGVWRGV